jgi:hypothetical protein
MKYYESVNLIWYESVLNNHLKEQNERDFKELGTDSQILFSVNLNVCFLQ